MNVLFITATVINTVNDQLLANETGRLFAVVHVAGKQRKVTVEDIVVLDKHIDASNGQRIRLNKVAIVFFWLPLKILLLLLSLSGIKFASISQIGDDILVPFH